MKSGVYKERGHKVDVKSANTARPSGMLVVRNDNGGNSFHMSREVVREMEMREKKRWQRER